MNEAQGLEAEEQEEDEGALDACLDSMEQAWAEDPTIQHCLEQPAWGNLRYNPRVKEMLKDSIVVAGCAYGERVSGKKYRLWMSKETLKFFTPIDPTGPDSLCETCKAIPKQPHTQGYAPKAGSAQGRIKTPGLSGAAARTRVPPKLAAAVGTAMRKAWERLNGRSS